MPRWCVNTIKVERTPALTEPQCLRGYRKAFEDVRMFKRIGNDFGVHAGEETKTSMTTPSAFIFETVSANYPPLDECGYLSAVLKTRVKLDYEDVEGNVRGECVCYDGEPETEVEDSCEEYYKDKFRKQYPGCFFLNLDEDISPDDVYEAADEQNIHCEGPVFADGFDVCIRWNMYALQDEDAAIHLKTSLGRSR